jgi:hypothetical protein
LFARLGISPTVVAGKAWSLAIPVLTELRYTRFSGIDYAVFRMTLGLAAGLEVAHRWETTSLGARLLVGRTVASTYHWEYEANWHDLRSDLDTTDVRLDVALHFH